MKIRQPGDARPKYAEAFRDRPELLLGSVEVPGLPLVDVEGEFDAILVGQELRDLALVVTAGPASVRPEPATLGRFLGNRPWFLATDADEAGDRAALAWSRSATRVRPPEPFKDWTEARQGGVDLRHWWTERLAGVGSPALFTWDQLSTQRWGGADDAPGIDVPIDWRSEVAGWPMPRWQAWHQRAGELEAEEVRPGDEPVARAEGIKRAQRRAYDEMTNQEGSDDDR